MSDNEGGVSSRCDTEECHRKTEWVVEVPSIDLQGVDRRACCSPCYRALVYGSELPRDKMAERRYRDTERSQSGSK